MQRLIFNNGIDEHTFFYGLSKTFINNNYISMPLCSR